MVPAKKGYARGFRGGHSCAAQFVASHLPEEWDGQWLHVDMAGPAVADNGRGTGYGVALLMELLGLGSK